MKTKIKEWFLRNRPNYELNLDGHVNLISDCIQDVTPQWVSVDDKIPLDESVMYWVLKPCGDIEIMHLNAYQGGSLRFTMWQGLGGDDESIHNTKYMPINKPEIPKDYGLGDRK